MPIKSGRIFVEKGKKEAINMENEKMLEILERIKICLEKDSLDIAKALVRLEIDNLKGITEQRCQNTKYYFYDSYCKYCSNLNCNSNKNK